MNKKIILLSVVTLYAGVVMGAKKILEIKVASSAFKNGAEIPREYGCIDSAHPGKKNDSPPLRWIGAPTSTKSFVIICEDPDAPGGTWIHWLVFNIPPTLHALARGENITALGGVVGKNSWQVNTFGGPCPPSGTHHYHFKIYALDVQLSLNVEATKRDVDSAMKNHIVGYGELVGTYTKK